MATRELDHPFDTCSHCGEAFDRDVRYPVTTERGPDGTLLLESFCDASCEAAWREAND